MSSSESASGPHKSLSLSLRAGVESWRVAAERAVPVRSLLQPFAVKPEPTPECVFRLKDAWEETLP